MAIIQCVTTSCKSELLRGIHDFNNDTIKVALYNDDADLGPDTTVYSSSNEITGTGYSAGGATLVNGSVEYSNGSAWVDWDDPEWSGADFIASGALFYNSSKDNRSVLVLSFGSARTFSGTANYIQLPQPTASTALMRIT